MLVGLPLFRHCQMKFSVPRNIRTFADIGLGVVLNVFDVLADFKLLVNIELFRVHVSIEVRGDVCGSQCSG